MLEKLFVRKIICDEEKIILIEELNDEDVKLIFDPKEFGEFIPDVAKAISKSYIDYAFLSKKEMIEREYTNKNILFMEADIYDIENLRVEFREILQTLRDSNCLFLKQTSIDFNSIQGQILKKYIQIGKCIREAEETKNFVHLIDSISKNKSPFLYKFTKEDIQNIIFKGGSNMHLYNHSNTDLPFVFVCASSGTGKTQLPFALDIPLLYILNNDKIVKSSNYINNEKNNQQIYLNFLNISQTFKSCVKIDAKTNFKNSFYSTDTDSMIAGFFVVLCREIMKVRKQNGDEHWAISQLRIASNERIKAMTSSKANTEM